MAILTQSIMCRIAETEKQKLDKTLPKLKLDSDTCKNKTLGYKVVFELEDDNNVDDVPNDYRDIQKGFKRKNAFFWGVEAVNKLDPVVPSSLSRDPYNAGSLQGRVELCAGYRGKDGCPRVNCHGVCAGCISRAKGGSKTPYGGMFGSELSTFNSIYGKILGCWVGAGKCGTFFRGDFCRVKFPGGYAADPAPILPGGRGIAAPGDPPLHFGCGEWGNHPNARCTNGNIHGYGNSGFHFTGEGLTANYASNNEVYMSGQNCKYNRNAAPAPVRNTRLEFLNLIQVRVRWP